MQMAQPRSLEDECVSRRPRDRTEIASRFRGLRKRAYFSQAKLARLIGVSRQSINEVESGRVLARESTWQRFFELEQRHEKGGAIQIRSDWTEILAELGMN